MSEILYTSHPSMFRNHPIVFIICFGLTPIYGFGLLILMLWWIECLRTTLTVTDEKTILRKGILAKYVNEIYHPDVRNVQVHQSAMQRILSVGRIGISSSGQSGIEILVRDVPDPNKVKEIIDRFRRQGVARQAP